MTSAESSNTAPAPWHTQNYYDEDAQRISNIIDEGLKVFRFLLLFKDS